MNYWTIDETAKKWGITPRQVRNYCAHGRIYGATLERGEWRIPADAAKPANDAVVFECPRCGRQVVHGMDWYRRNH